MLLSLGVWNFKKYNTLVGRMGLPINKPCLFCGGRYAKLNLERGFEEHYNSTLMIDKTEETGVVMAKTVNYRCSTCGNIQSFLENEPQV